MLLAVGLGLGRHPSEKVHSPSAEELVKDEVTENGRFEYSPAQSDHPPCDLVTQRPRFPMAGHHLKHHLVVPSFVRPGQRQGA